MLKNILVLSLASISLVQIFSDRAFAKIDCSTKSLTRTYTVPKDCKIINIKAWGGGAAGKANFGYGGAFAMGDYEIPAGSKIDIKIGAGGKAGHDGESTTISYNGTSIMIAIGGQHAEEDSCVAFPLYLRGMSHFEYPTNSTAAGANDEDYVKLNKNSKPGYAYGVDGAEGMCGLAVISCKEKVEKKKKK